MAADPHATHTLMQRYRRQLWLAGLPLVLLLLSLAGWTLLANLPGGDPPWQAVARELLPLGLVALALLGLFVHAQAMLQKRVLAPIQALMGYLEAKAREPGAPAPQLESAWQHWVDVITRTFDAERSARAGQLRSEAFKSAIVDNALAGIVVTDAAGQVVEFNPAAERMFGYRREQALGRSIAELIIPPHLRQAHEDGMKRMATGGPPRILGQRVELVAMHAEGRTFPVELVLWRTDLAGEVHYTASLMDLSEQQRSALEIARQREALRQSEKLSAMGSLLAGVAHELNNPLAIALGRACWLEERSTDEGVRHDARLIREATERCGRIVRTFLNMARSRPPQPQAVALDELVRAALDLLGHNLRSHGIHVRLALGAGLPPVWADPDRLGQVVLNLIVNAQQALAEQTTLRELHISAAPSARPPGVVGALGTPGAVGGGGAASWAGRGAHGGAQLAAGVCLRVVDSGPGVPEALRQRIFEPFFTTKPEGLGTGLGLAMARSLVEEEGGALWLEPSASGAAFALWLPLAGQASGSAGALAAASSPDDEAADADDACARILVVDDEPELAALWRDGLERAGYEVLVAESGEVALELLALGPVDALVTDLRMPGLDGPQLWRALARHQPGLQQRTLFVTGDTLSPGVADFLRRSGCPVLEKPFAALQLCEAVAALLAPPGCPVQASGTKT